MESGIGAPNVIPGPPHPAFGHLLPQGRRDESVAGELGKPNAKHWPGSAVVRLVASLFVLSLLVTIAQAFPEPKITDDDRDHWAFSPLPRPEIPRPDFAKQPDLADWSRNPIDEFVLTKLVENDLAPMPGADRVTLIRRLSFDLTGLPPTPDDVDAFVNDPRPDAFEQLVEKLLASSAYGERWGQHWLDLARFAETDGFEHDKLRPDAWKFRDWVIAALNEDLPYDKFVLAQLAGDEPPNANRIAAGFLTCGPDMPDINLQEERRHSFLNDMTATVGSVFLGLQIGCAQCHDNKFDPVSQLDFYRMRSFFDRAFDFTKNKTVALPTGNGKSFKSHLMIRGDFRRPGESVSPAFLRIANPQALAPKVAAGEAGRRTQLARWITRPDNPLSTRVLANRLWHYHFGEGLSQSPSDFGLLGDVPVHLELLDWLATEIPRRGWSLKEMHRLIVTSATWRQASRRPESPRPGLIVRWEKSLAEDRLNRLHSRGRRRRLEGEAIRDAMLAVSGQLNQRRRGPGIRPPLPPELVQALLRNQWPVSKNPADFSRRSIYLFVRRNLRFPLFEAFDKPDTNASCPRRNESTIAPQALMLLNSDLSLDAAKALAGRILTEAGSDRGKQIELAYRLALGRRRTPAEAESGITFLKRDAALLEIERRNGATLAMPSGPLPVSDEQAAALTDFCLAIFNVNEFLYVD